MNDPRDKPYSQQMIDAFYGEPVLCRIRFVQNLIGNRAGSPDDPDTDPVFATAFKILDEVIKDIESDEDVAHFPRRPTYSRPSRSNPRPLQTPKP